MYVRRAYMYVNKKVISRGPQCYECSRCVLHSTTPSVYAYQHIHLVIFGSQVQLSSVGFVSAFGAASRVMRGSSFEPRFVPIFIAVTYRPT